MNIPKVSIKKLTYTYTGFGEYPDKYDEQIASISYMTINTSIESVYDSVVLLNVVNKADSGNNSVTKYQYNTLFYVDDNGVGYPINSITARTISTIENTVNDNGETTGIADPDVDTDNSINSNSGNSTRVLRGGNTVSVATSADVSIQSQEYYLAQQQVALDALSSTVNSIMTVIKDRSSAIGINSSTAASNAMNAASVSYSYANHAIRDINVGEMTIQVNAVKDKISDAIAAEGSSIH